MSQEESDTARPSPIRRTLNKVRRGVSQPSTHARPPWKILVVDDEPDIHAVTGLVLSNLIFDGRGLDLLHAYSGTEARALLADPANQDVAIALVDVVMECDDAGLQLVHHIRRDRNNRLIRLIIRTGQPGYAPERQVIENYDIDDYKEKTELTASKLFTTIRLSLKGYSDLMVIEKNKKGLEYILKGAPEIYNLSSLQDFCWGVLMQVVGMFRTGDDSLMTSTASEARPHALLITNGTGQRAILPDFHCGTGRFQERAAIPEATLAHCMAHCMAALACGTPCASSESTYTLPLMIKGELVGLIYLEDVPPLHPDEQALLEVMTRQISAALENHWLYHSLTASRLSLVQAHDHAIFMLAMASELKDRETGNHINRIQYYSEALARQMGMEAEEAQTLGKASTLHDLGKLGIPDAIIRKPGKLTDEEFAIIKTHPKLAMNIFGDHPGFEMAKQIALCHHEKWDGAGYPERLQGEAVPLPARIVAVADVLDALASERPYKNAWPMEEAVAEIQRCSGRHFDPHVVDALTQLYADGTILAIKARFPEG